MLPLNHGDLPDLMVDSVFHQLDVLETFTTDFSLKNAEKPVIRWVLVGTVGSRVDMEC